MVKITRRALVRLMGIGAGSAFVSMGVSACGDDGDGGSTDAGSPDAGNPDAGGVDAGTADTGSADAGMAPTSRFDHGVASGDPLSDRVIIWTRVTPIEAGPRTVMWQVATDPDFMNLVVQGEGTTDASRDYTVKVDAMGLQPGTRYYYRFMSGGASTPVGQTKTLPTGSVSQAKFVVFSCSNYPTGYFHAYAEAARVADVDAAIHLGDYIYEYDRSGYASQNAAMIGRESLPDSELFSLDDYRARYAQYRTDSSLQLLHGALPMIAVWDDHEVANDAYDGGAENHQMDEGPWADRLAAALQAYAEWMPIRPPVDEGAENLQRAFEFGDLVRLIMIDTRIVGRDQQINLADFFDAMGNFDGAAYAAAVGDPNRTLLGADQRAWLTGQLQQSATWHVLGNQVLMGTMELPAAVLPSDPSDPSSAPLTLTEYATLAGRAQAGDPTLTAEELALLALPSLPYNLDAWDGYPVERATILGVSAAAGNNLVVLAGDTHNAWASNLVTAGATPAPAGVELATASVTSPGLEAFLGIQSSAQAGAFEGGVVGLIPGLQYTNLFDRGFMTVTFTPTEATAEWTFVGDILSPDATVQAGRSRTLSVPVGTNALGTT